MTPRVGKQKYKMIHIMQVDTIAFFILRRKWKSQGSITMVCRRQRDSIMKYRRDPTATV